MALSRSKQPQILRVRILHASQQVLLEDGLVNLTQERVLHKLDISKGDCSTTSAPSSNFLTVSLHIFSKYLPRNTPSNWP